LHEFKHENDKFASIKHTLKEQAAQLQQELDEKTKENTKLLGMCESLMTELEQARGSSKHDLKAI
jgi:predicted nuclease with TOPRIM domain